MKIQVLLLAATLFTFSASAQTKKIFHRSHSGSDVSFSSDRDNDNFGIVMRPEKFDTLKPVNPLNTTPPSDQAQPQTPAKQKATSTPPKKTKTKAKKAAANKEINKG